LLTDATGFPLNVAAFEGNKATDRRFSTHLGTALLYRSCAIPVPFLAKWPFVTTRGSFHSL